MSAGSLSTFLSNRYRPQPFRATGRLSLLDDDQREALRPLRAAAVLMICWIGPASIGQRLLSAGHRKDLSFPDGLGPTAKESKEYWIKGGRHYHRASRGTSAPHSPDDGGNNRARSAQNRSLGGPERHSAGQV